MTDATSSTSASGRSIDVNGVALYYEEQGEGDPVILIHGGFASSASWQAVLPPLVDGLRVITPDSRGHGRSTNPAGELSYPLIADDVAALIGALELARPVVGGWSDGGQVAMELGARHPGVAGGLIVGAAYPDFGAGGLRETMRGVLGADDAGTPDIAQVDEFLGDFAGVVKSWHPGGAQQWQALVQQSAPMWLDYAGLTPDDLQEIVEPALVLTGDRDELITLDLLVSLYRALPNAELAVCPQADHFGPLMPERAGVFAGMIRDFAGRHTQAR
jgi:pimeloyl-ACP methyl ester carboxylesterase